MRICLFYFINKLRNDLRLTNSRNEPHHHIVIIDYETVFEDCDITSIDDDTFANRKFFLSYEINDNLYLLASTYNNGKYI